MLLRRLDKAISSVRSEDRLKKLRELATFDDSVSFEASANISNRYDSREAIEIGPHSRIEGNLFLFRHGGSISLGAYVFLGPGSHVWSSNAVKIGNHVLISHNVNIHDCNSHPIDVHMRRKHTEYILDKKSLPDSSYGTSDAPVHIEDDVWIGFNAIILKGVTIGKGAIVAAGSVVTRDVGAFTLVAGNPAVLKKTLT